MEIIERSDWALRRLSGTILSYLRLGLAAKKRATLQAVRGAERLAREWGAPEPLIRQTALGAIESSPACGSTEAAALRAEFSLA